MPPGMPFGPQGFNDTFGPQMPLGSPFGPAGLGAPQFGSPIPMFPFNRTQMNSPFPGAQPFPTSPFQPGFPQRNPGVGPGRLGGEYHLLSLHPWNAEQRKPVKSGNNPAKIDEGGFGNLAWKLVTTERSVQNRQEKTKVWG